MLFRRRSYLPLLVLPLALGALTESGLFEARFGERVEITWDVFCLVVAFSGLGIRVLTVGFVPAGTSGRNTASQRADRLNSTGLYSVVRNPLYLGNMVTLVGFALATQVWWFPLLVAALALLYYERIVFAEEAYLQRKFGADYDTWAARTPALFPSWRNWQRPDLPFSLATAIRREYHGVGLIAITMTVVEIVGDVAGEGESASDWLREEYLWLAFLGCATVIYLAVRFTRKRTDWLVVPGR